MCSSCNWKFVPVDQHVPLPLCPAPCSCINVFTDVLWLEPTLLLVFSTGLINFLPLFSWFPSFFFKYFWYYDLLSLLAYLTITFLLIDRLCYFWSLRYAPLAYHNLPWIIRHFTCNLKILQQYNTIYLLSFLILLAYASLNHLFLNPNICYCLCFEHLIVF